ncbi:flagellar biosynthetic protein FliO [bacterium]|nr:flagellar biosynthetic protein FliO [bacterium]
MGGYLINFSVYTLSMVGVIFCALFVFKSVMGGKGFSKKSSFIKVTDSVKLSPRKTLFVVNAGNEKFLIASDTDRTTLISKLEKIEANEENQVALTTGSTKDYSIKTETSNIEKFVQKKSIKDILNKRGNDDFFSKPKSLKPQLKQEKEEGLNSLYGKDNVEEEFSNVLSLRKKSQEKQPMMKGIASKLHF